MRTTRFTYTSEAIFWFGFPKTQIIRDVLDPPNMRIVFLYHHETNKFIRGCNKPKGVREVKRGCEERKGGARSHYQHILPGITYPSCQMLQPVPYLLNTFSVQASVAYGSHPVMQNRPCGVAWPKDADNAFLCTSLLSGT